VGPQARELVKPIVVYCRLAGPSRARGLLGGHWGGLNLNQGRLQIY